MTATGPAPIALVSHPACLRHRPHAGHPECPERLTAVLTALEDARFAGLARHPAPAATEADLRLVHSATYVRDLLARDPPPGDVIALDPDTELSAGTAEAALRAAGGSLYAVDLVLKGEASRAFAAVRPPGHHARPAAAMGFCLFSNAAIAALHARARWGLHRVAVVDFDVHHGNGTAEVCAPDPGLFYASSHQWPCYPGTGSADERGVAGNIVNVPLPPGSGGQRFRDAWSDTILPALAAFAPELVIVSAGFDAHRADPLAQLCLEVEDFGWLSAQLVAVAGQCCGGRLVSLLEGGYDLDALAAAVAAHVAALLSP
jgi:acetoin utilization deacetylase AcuC-like enzyme